MKRIFLLLLVLCTSFMLFACGDEPCTEHKDENNDGTCDVCGEAVVKEPNEIALIKDGAATFKIVLPAGASGELRLKIQNDIVAVLHNLDVEVEVLDDVSEGKTECEVLINTVTTRGDKYNIDPHYLGAKGYAVKLVGTKVMIMAGSDKALDDAIKYFVKEVLGISGKTKSLDNVTMTKEMSFEEIQDDYDIDSVSVAGNNLKDYVIAVDMSNGMDTAVADAVQSLIYEKCGIWLKCVPIATEASKKFVIKTVSEACEEGFSVTVDNGNIVMECEFPEKFKDAALGFVRTHITSKTGEVKLTATLSYTKNVRVIYYKEFGAKGDGKQDDFIAIRDCHNYANKHGHDVSADVGAIYYIGDAAIKLPTTAQREIYIKTNTNWNDAKFIFDDAIIPVEYKYETHKYEGKDVTYLDLEKECAGDEKKLESLKEDAVCSKCLKKIFEDKNGCTQKSGGWHSLSIFVIQSDSASFSLTKNFEGTKINKGDKYITLADGSKYVPGRPVLIKISDSTKRHYIREGANANNGSAQTEIVLIQADGTIDSSTPLHWDYTVVSSATGKYVDDKPITVGATDSKGCIITTMANQGPNYYYSYGRNIVTERSNTTVIGIKHYIEGEGLPGKGKCPQSGFTRTDYCNNVSYENMLYTHQRGHKDASNGTALGTYEIAAGSANNLYWRNCDQTNFYQPDGSVKSRGFYGTNYCKNFYIYDSLMCSFDAHCGTYNVTLVRSTFEHINCVGEGLIYLEDVTVYTDATDSMICLRGDYGYPWRGELYAKGVTLKHAQNHGNDEVLSVFKGGWTNHIFGFECYMPSKVTLDNVKTQQYTYSNATGLREDRKESIVSTNNLPINLYKGLDGFVDVDISDPDAVMPNASKYLNDLEKCTCSETNPPRSGKPYFNDTDGDGRCNNTIISKKNVGNTTWCWGYKETPDPKKNVNPYHPTEEVYINNCPGLQFRLPPTPQFAKTKIFVDGVEQPLGTTSLTVPKKED